MGKYEVRYDEGKNRLYLRVEGFMRDGEAREAIDALRRGLESVQSDFDVVTDITGFVPTSPAVAKSLRLAGEMVRAKGRRHSVRVAGGVATALLQLKRELKGVFDESTVRYAKTLEEAESLLDNWE